jgi:hypothetical protein
MVIDMVTGQRSDALMHLTFAIVDLTVPLLWPLPLPLPRH